MSSLTSWSPHVLSLLRIASGAAFMAHGTMKWLSFPPRDFPQPEVFSMTGPSGAIEFIGVGLILLGLFTRPAAFICSGMMAYAYFPLGRSSWREKRWYTLYISVVPHSLKKKK